MRAIFVLIADVAAAPFALAKVWTTVYRCGMAVGPDPNGPDAPFDFDANGRIDLADIASFSEYWLQRTDCQGPVTDPSKPSPSL